jgi:hypothetical protein
MKTSGSARSKTAHSEAARFNVTPVNTGVEPDTRFEQEILNRAAYESNALDLEAFENRDLQRLFLLLHLVPVFGLVPSVWSLTNRQSDRQQRATSRLAITLAVVWALGYAGLNVGAMGGGAELNPLGSSLLLFNTLLTSGYFVTSMWLMLRVWQKQAPHLPGISTIAKHLP